MHTATIRLSDAEFKCSVDFERRTRHPESVIEKASENDILDERVPKNLIISCSKTGAVSCVPIDEKPIERKGSIIDTKLAIYENPNGQWFISEGTQGIKAKWNSNWAVVKCISEGHAEHILNLLEQGILELGEGVEVITV